MASEAQRLIGISLTKIAQSRSHRGGVSLHKNLLVATVLQKARYIFMEEAYNMVHYQPQAPIQARPVPQEELVGLTAEEAGLESLNTPDGAPEASTSSDAQTEPQCVRCMENQNQNKENHPPTSQSPELTYLDLDKSSNVLRERPQSNLKRRRAVTETETEEAVQSILPKRCKSDEEESDATPLATSSPSENDDDVFLDNATSLAEKVKAEQQEEESSAKKEEEKSHVDQENGQESAMEIDRITSLVSIFSFSMDSSKLRSDLCSAQAKEIPEIQQRPFLAMTV